MLHKKMAIGLKESLIIRSRLTNMKEFFQVLDIDAVLALRKRFDRLDSEKVRLGDALGRVLFEDVAATCDLPGFDRATMDGFAVCAASTYGASESNPAYLDVVGAVVMGQAPDFKVGPGQAARIATGGMLPEGADSVVMVEHTDNLDANTIEVHRSVAPGQHRVTRDEDVARGQLLFSAGRVLKPQDIGLLAAIGRDVVSVFRRPRVGLIPTGDEVVPLGADPGPGQIRDVNTHTLGALVREAGGQPVAYDIVADRFEALFDTFQRALAENDMVMVSGGSSVGMRDLTLDALEALDQSSMLFHGVSIRPGKPTMLARCGAKAFWGLPGHVTSAMVVFMVLVRPFLDYIGGRGARMPGHVRARLSRNLASVQGRVDFVRVWITEKEGHPWAEPILGQSGLLHTMVEADGLVAIDMNDEGLDQGSWVDVILI
jgi:molybdopterin molybdotransferase